MKSFFRNLLKGVGFLLGALVFLALLDLLVYVFTPAKTEGPWEFGQERLAQIEVQDNKVRIKNLRDIDWNSSEPKPNYKNITFDIEKLSGLEVVVSHFSAFDPLAHVFLIFKNPNGESIAISAESRRELGEEFSLLGGLTGRYELIYIVGTQDDLLGLRQKRKEKYQIYPINATPEQIQKLFVALVKDINEAHTNPKLYHLFFRNCTNVITSRVRKLNSNYNFSFLVTTFAPGKVGEMLEKMGLVKTQDH